MISLKKYLESARPEHLHGGAELDPNPSVLTAALIVYGSAMHAMGHCSLEACPSIGDDLKVKLGELNAKLSLDIEPKALEEIDRAFNEHLQAWSRRAANYYNGKAGEVKELLLAMARMAESLSSRDQRCADQMNLVTARLKQIATLDDLSQIRASVERGAADLKNSIDRMTEEGKAVIDQMQSEMVACRAKLEEVEEMASRDGLTRLRNRMSIEKAIKDRIAAGAEFCVVLIDINDFKSINDRYGHVMGDEVLRLFAGELRSACRTSDLTGRWGGDEFILVLDCSLEDATGRINRLRQWVCGDYTLRTGERSTLKLRVDAAFGLTEYRAPESMKDLIDRADAAMYEKKTASRRSREASIHQLIPA